MRIAYLLDVFPVLSETFIVREIYALRKLGKSVCVFAVARRQSSVVHSESAALVEHVRFLAEARLSQRKLSLIPLHLKYMVRRPLGYVRALVQTIGRSRRVLQCFVWAPAYADLLRAEGVEHIHAHFVLHGCLHAMFISLLTGIPYSVTVHAHDIFNAKYAELRAEKLKRSAFIAAISKFNKSFLEEHYPDLQGEKIRIVHCGIDVERIGTRPMHRDSGPMKLLAVGRLVEMKGFAYLVEACALLKARCAAEFLVEIIGDGDQRASLEAAIEAHGLQGTVVLLGPRDQDFVHAALLTADAFVLPCVREANGMMDGIPVALMEAMANGVPVVSTRVSGVPELIVDGGYLVESQNVEALTDALQRLLDMSTVERRELGARGKAIIAQDFNIEREAGRLASLMGA